jgi:hypothetical protein
MEAFSTRPWFWSPNIKHHRVPAPGISFEQPNLPTLIEEIQREILPSSPPP